jgi:hypothetical protein
MTKLRLSRNIGRLTSIALLFTGSAMAEWKAANEQVAAAAKEPGMRLCWRPSMRWMRRW